MLLTGNVLMRYNNIMGTHYANHILLENVHEPTICQSWYLMALLNAWICGYSWKLVIYWHLRFYLSIQFLSYTSDFYCFCLSRNYILSIGSKIIRRDNFKLYYHSNVPFYKRVTIYPYNSCSVLLTFDLLWLWHKFIVDSYPIHLR